MLHRAQIYAADAEAAPLALGDYVVGFFAHDGAIAAGTGEQFTSNNEGLTVFREAVLDVTELTETGSVVGKVGAGALGDSGGPDYAHHAVRQASTEYFNTDADVMSVMDLAAWTYIARFSLEGSGAGTSIFCAMKHSTAASGPHISINQTTLIPSIMAPGTDDGNIAFDGAISRSFAYTFTSRFDGTTHYAAIYDDDGTLIQALTATHSGTTTDGDDFHLFGAGQNAPMRFKRYAAYNGFLDDATLALLVANFQTEALPGS